MRIHEEILGQHEARIDSARLVERVLVVARPLVDTHHANIGTAEERVLDPHYGVIGESIGTARPCIHIQQTKSDDTERSPAVSVYWLFCTLVT
jgi:hypothetical protein